MTEPKPPLARVTERVADTAKSMVDDSAAAMIAESKIIDNDEYELAHAIATATRLAEIGITGAAHIGRINLEEKPPDTVFAMGEKLAAVLRRMVSQTGTVAADASRHMENKDYTPKRWLESMTRLIDIGVAGGMEAVETVVAGPARFEVHPVRSDEFVADVPAGETLLLVATDLRRDATDAPIPTHQIRFEPPTLVGSNRTFRLLVDPSDVVSGVYQGVVLAAAESIDGGRAGAVRAQVDVSILL